MAKTNTNHGTTRAAAQDLQKEACYLVADITGVPWGGSKNDDAEIKPRQSGQPGVDVVMSPRVRDIMDSMGVPTCIECKNTKQWDLQRAILQARANTPKGQAWMLVLKRRAPFKAERIDPVVVMDMKVFKQMILACLDLGKQMGRQEL